MTDPKEDSVGAKTFVFTDIVGSTGLKQLMAGRSGTERDQRFARELLSPHRARILSELEAFGGRLVSTAGDGNFLAFDSPLKAVMWAIALQQDHEERPIDTPDGKQLGLKVGIHWGPASRDPNDPRNYVGRNVDWAARLVELGTRGKVLVSQAVAEMVRNEEISGVELFEHGVYELAGIGPRPVLEVLYADQKPGPLKRSPDVSVPRREGPTPDYGPLGSTIIEAPAPPRVGTVLKNCYKLEEQIGVGGMGTVFRATHVALRAPRVVKVINSNLLRTGNDESIERFYREIRLAGQLDHPNVVHAYDSSNRRDGVHFLVMELIEGVSLERLVAHRRLTLPQACEIIRQAALGLQCIHEHGMVHRDIKPSNLMLTVADGQPLVKILDLGLALLVSDVSNRLTDAGKRGLGTAYYMAPEQWRSSTVDVRADIYSLGCTFYQLLEGRAPFDRSKYTQEWAHCNLEPPPVERVAGLPTQVRSIVKTMLAKSPDNRFATPAEVAAAVAPLANAAGLAELIDQQRASSDAEAPPAASGQADADDEDQATEVDRWRPSRRTMIGALAAAGLCGGVGLMWWQDYRSGQLQQARQKEAARSEYLSRLEADVATLPGLNGGWWFEEVPWLTPRVRAMLVQEMHGATEAPLEATWRPLAALLRSPDPSKVYQALFAEAGKLVGSLPEAMKKIHAQLMDPGYDPQDVVQLASELQRLVGTSGGSAEDVHLLAVMQASGTVQESDAAGTTYERAIEQYKRASASAASGDLAALCRVDYAQWLLQRRELGRAGGQLTLALVKETDRAPLLRYSALRSRSQVLASDRKWSESSKSLLDAAAAVETLLDKSHPLLAWVLEEQAWRSMDQWQVSRAKTLFAGASNLRAAAEKKFQPHTDGDSIILLTRLQNEIEILHDDHGLAMVDRYSGRAEEGRKAYLNLHDKVNELLGQYPSEPRARQLLYDRLVNTVERLGDAYFYDPASTLDDLGKACGHWASAAEFAQRVGSDDSSTVSLARLSAKQSLARAMQEDPDASKQLADEVDQRLNPKLSDKQRLQHAGYLELAEVLRVGEMNRDAAWRERLRAFLAAFLAREGNRPAQLQRDNRELALLAYRELLRADGKAAADGKAGPDGQDKEGPRLFAEDATGMEKLLPESIDDAAVLRFLRPHFDVLITAVLAGSSADSLKHAARLMQWAKLGHNDIAPAEAGARIVVYLRPTTGLAVVLPPDLDAKAPVELSIGWKALRSGSSAQVALAKQQLREQLEAAPCDATPPIPVHWRDLGLARPLGEADFPIPPQAAGARFAFAPDK